MEKHQHTEKFETESHACKVTFAARLKNPLRRAITYGSSVGAVYFGVSLLTTANADIAHLTGTAIVWGVVAALGFNAGACGVARDVPKLTGHAFRIGFRDGYERAKDDIFDASADIEETEVLGH
jgi:hypothetical protein